MYNIFSINPKTGKEVLVENFCPNKRESLNYWRNWGMSNVFYKAVKASIGNSFNKDKRNH